MNSNAQASSLASLPAWSPAEFADSSIPSRARGECVPIPVLPPWKSVMDRILAVALLVLTLPVMVVAIVLVRLTSRGPAIFRQARLGLDGRPFTIYKIRTMYRDCERPTGPRWLTPGDPRVTPIGRILRARHIDELPQICNILGGAMSLVGPRPERPEIVGQIEQALPAYRERLQVLPGITGLAQVQLGPDSDIESVRRKLACDLYYIRRGDAWLDLRIMVATAFEILGVPARVACELLRIPGVEVAEAEYRDRSGGMDMPSKCDVSVEAGCCDPSPRQTSAGKAGRATGGQVGEDGIVSSPADPLRGRDILCFSTDWSWDAMTMTHLMRLLARDNRVLWVNSIGYRRPTVSRADAGRAMRKLRAALEPVREVEPNLFVLSPLIIPLYDLAGLRAANRRLLRAQVAQAMRRLGFGRPVNFVFLPTAGLVAGDFGEELLIYYCVDEFTGFAGVAARALAEQEADLARRSDLVVVTLTPLLRSKSPLNPHTVLVRNGVNFEHFRRALDPATRIPDAIAALPRPIIGFFGLVAADWVDVGLLCRVADRFPHASLVILGLVTTDVSALRERPNVHLLGQVPYADLPAFCKGFDVALIPFRINEVTLNSNPLKAREYLSAGLPIVSTAIPEVEELGHCRIAADEESFLSHVAASLDDPGPSLARSEAMRQEGWTNRLGELRAHLSDIIPRGRSGRPADELGRRHRPVDPGMERLEVRVARSVEREISVGRPAVHDTVEPFPDCARPLVVEGHGWS